MEDGPQRDQLKELAKTSICSTIKFDEFCSAYAKKVNDLKVTGNLGVEQKQKAFKESIDSLKISQQEKDLIIKNQSIVAF